MKQIIIAAGTTAMSVVIPLLSTTINYPQAVLPSIVGISIVSMEDRAHLYAESAQNERTAKETREYTVDEVHALISFYAAKYGVNAEIMRWTVSCETGGTFDPNIQSFVSYSRDHPEWGVKKGQQEESYGLAQIHVADPGNSHITIEMARDPHFALNFMALEFAAGNYWKWGCL